ncbi:fiber protein [uncultured Mediterranean phage uvMED]|nr:fiber protein [uncultured Mediterranean phage uvMED]
MAQTTKNSIALPDPGASAGSWGQVLNDAIESVDVLIDQHKVPNGGNANQVLAKASGTNYDVEWQTIAGMGDTVDSLTGGNGINVSSSAGNVTLSVNANTLRSHLSVEANSKDDQTGAEIKSLYEAESDTNAFTDSEKTKLTNINTATHTLDTNLTSVSTSDDSIASAKAIKDYVDTQDATKQNTIADGDLTIAKTNGLQTALDAKATSASLTTHTSSTSNPHSVTKTQVGLSNVENTALSTWAGSTNVTTVGTVSTGTWEGTQVADAYIASASTWNAKATIDDVIAQSIALG